MMLALAVTQVLAEKPGVNVQVFLHTTTLTTCNHPVQSVYVPVGHCWNGVTKSQRIMGCHRNQILLTQYDGMQCQGTNRSVSYAATANSCQPFHIFLPVYTHYVIYDCGVAY